MTNSTPSQTVARSAEDAPANSVSATEEGKPSKFSDAERAIRSERMKRMNAEGRTGPQFSHLGGRPRNGETKEQARERREKERSDAILESLQRVNRPVVTPHVPDSSGARRLSDEEESARRVFLATHRDARRSSASGSARPRRTARPRTGR